MREAAAIEFLKTVSGDVAIFAHDDADGCCSAALIWALLKQRGLRPKLLCGDIDEDDFARFATEKLDAAIFLDFSIDQYPAWLRPWHGKAVLIIDHHPPTNDLNEIGFIHINPRFEKPDIYVSTAQITRALCVAAGLSGFEWLARLGAVGDHALEGTEEEIRATNIIAAVKAIRKAKGLAALAKFLAGCSQLEQFVYRETYHELESRYSREIEQQLAKFELEVRGPIAWFEVRSRYSITGSLASRLFELYPQWTIITFTKDRECRVSGRSAAFDLGRAFAVAAVAAGGTGGGHPTAAAAKIPTARFDIFRRRLSELLDSKLQVP